MSYYVHHVPGRVRVRIPAVRANRHKAAEIEKLLRLPGVEKLEINHLTGSVVAIYDPDKLDAHILLDVLSAKGYYDSGLAITCDEKIRQTTSVAAAKAGRVFFGWAVGKALESSGLSLLAVFI